MNTPCPLCRRPTRLGFTVPDATGSEVPLAYCNQCHIFATTYSRTVALIEDQTTFHEELWADSADETLERERLELCDMVDRLKVFLPPVGGAVLDVGCGRGALVAALRDRGYEAGGVDASKVLIETARSTFDLADDVAVAADAFAYLAGAAANVAAIFLWHVLEHVEDPVRLLKLCCSRLTVGGHLLIQVPALHPAWVYRQHLMLVTPFTARVIARIAGCQLESAAYDSSFAFLTIVLRKGGDGPSTADVAAIDAQSPELAALQGLYLTAVGDTPRGVVGRR